MPPSASCWAAVSGSGERPGHIVSHFNDVTAFKLAQQRQAEATAQFETAFADAPIGMALVALHGRLLKVNRVLCRQSGYSAEQLLASTFQEMTHPDDLDGDLEQLQWLIAGEIDRYVMEKRYFTAGGTSIWTNLAVSLVRDVLGRPMHFVSELEDISERKRLEAELQHRTSTTPMVTRPETLCSNASPALSPREFASPIRSAASAGMSSQSS
jgi:PAS domain S-box-containing protein